MLTIGCHLSASEGFLAMGKTALSIGANTFQFFTRNPRGSKAKAIDPDDAAAFLALAQANGFGRLVAHAPYTINPCSKTERTREFARMTLADDLKRMEYLPGNYYNFHPGSHTEQGMEVGISQIAETLNAILKPEQHTTVLLETMSGKGSEVGGRFEELREILDRVALNTQMGVCMDTCHISDAGVRHRGRHRRRADGVRPRHRAGAAEGRPHQRQHEPAGRPQGPPRPHRRGLSGGGGLWPHHQSPRPAGPALYSGNAQRSGGLRP